MVNISVYNCIGERVINRTLTNLAPEARLETFDVADLARGIYVVEISTGDIKDIRRIVVE